MGTDLVQVRPSLPVSQVLPPVRAVAVHITGPRVTVHMYGLPQGASLTVHLEGGDLTVPVAHGDQVGPRHVPRDVTRGSAVDKFSVSDIHIAGVSKSRQ